MIGRKEKSKEKKYREDETDNDNINLKDSPQLIKVLKHGEGVNPVMTSSFTSFPDKK